jgi:hypothetical protein
MGDASKTDCLVCIASRRRSVDSFIAGWILGQRVIRAIMGDDKVEYPTKFCTVHAAMLTKADIEELMGTPKGPRTGAVE